MSEANYSKDYIDLTHRNILETLERIENQTKLTNGRVNKLEDRLVQTDANVAKYLSVLSEHSTIIKGYKEEKDRAQEKLIEQQERRLQELEEKKQEEDRRIRNAMIIAILFIAGAIGLVNWDFVKQFL